MNNIQETIWAHYTMNEINVQSVEIWIILILLNRQSYKQLGLMDIHKQYTMNEINVQSVIHYWKRWKERIIRYCYIDNVNNK